MPGKKPERSVILYSDESGRSPVAKDIAGLRDAKLKIKIRKKLKILAEWSWDDLLSSETVKSLKGKDADEIYELKLAGSGPWGWRLFFFRSTCKPKTVVVTELEQRQYLNVKGAFDNAIKRTARLRDDWERRNCEDT
jgi:hypothetical protein